MRRRITKAGRGRAMSNRKDVSLKLNKSGLSADGRQRWVVAVRFANDSHLKASNTEYVAIEIDDVKGRMYFISSNNSEGFKLCVNNKNSKTKNISFSIDDIREWEAHEGVYDMLHDDAERLYYIDFAKKI